MDGTQRAPHTRWILRHAPIVIKFKDDLISMGDFNVLPELSRLDRFSKGNAEQELCLDLSHNVDEREDPGDSQQEETSDKVNGIERSINKGRNC